MGGLGRRATSRRTETLGTHTTVPHGAWPVMFSVNTKWDRLERSLCRVDAVVRRRAARARRSISSASCPSPEVRDSSRSPLERKGHLIDWDCAEVAHRGAAVGMVLDLQLGPISLRQQVPKAVVVDPGQDSAPMCSLAQETGHGAILSLASPKSRDLLKKPSFPLTMDGGVFLHPALLPFLRKNAKAMNVDGGTHTPR